MATRRKEREEEAEKYAEDLLGVFRRAAGDISLLKAFFQDILSPGEYKELGCDGRL